MNANRRFTRNVALLAAAYYAIARLGLLAAVAAPVVSSAWPPAGLALAALLLGGARLWPGVLLGAFALNATAGVPLAAAALIGAGNAAAAVLAARLLDRLALDRDLARLRDALALLAGALAGPLVAASVGVAALFLAGHADAAGAGRLWAVWWSGDALGILVVTPLVLAWRRPRDFRLTAGRAVEAALLAAALALLTWLLFRTSVAFVYVAFPLASWAAIRFGVRGGSTAVALVAALSVWYTLAQSSPFSGATPMADLFMLQMFLALLAATTLALAAAVRERGDAERRARDSEQGLREAQALAHLGSWTWEAGRDALRWSPELSRMFGREWQPGPTGLQALLDAVHPDDRADVRAAVALALETGQPFRVEQRVVRGDGEVRVLDAVGEALRDGGGRVVALRGICYDITEHKRAEHELRRAEQRFRLFVESVRDYAIVMLDAEGRVTTWNPGAERVKGFPGTAILGRHYRQFYTEEDQALGRPEANLRIAARFGWVQEEGWRVREDGARYWADVTIASVRDEGGTLLGYAKVTRDLTERRRAEGALREREQLLEAMFDRTASGIALLDTTGRFVRVNRRFETLLGYAASELADVALDALMLAPERDHARTLALDLLAGRRETAQTEARYRRRDGEVVWLLTTMAVIPAPDGSPRNVITIVEDISAQRRAQEQLGSSREELRALSQKLLGVQEAERTRLARELHDQIGQALSAVMISLESLLRPGASERRKASRVQDSMAVVEHAIEQVRTLSFDLRPSMLDDLGLGAAAAAYCKRQTKLAGLELDLDVGPLTGAPPKTVEAACFRILQEAVTNVLRHAGATRLKVRLGGDDRELDLSVEDDGRGFDPEKLREAGPGFHLGILGMRERAELVGGTVHVDSAPGRGTFVQAHFTYEEGTSDDR